MAEKIKDEKEDYFELAKGFDAEEETKKVLQKLSQSARKPRDLLNTMMSNAPRGPQIDSNPALRDFAHGVHLIHGRQTLNVGEESFAIPNLAILKHGFMPSMMNVINTGRAGVAELDRINKIESARCIRTEFMDAFLNENDEDRMLELLNKNPELKKTYANRRNDCANGRVR